MRQAFAWTADGPTVVEFDTRADELRPAGQFGTGCDGIVHVLLEQPASMPRDALDVIARVWETREPQVIATVYDGPGDMIGTRAVWTDGEVDGLDVEFDLENSLQWNRPRSVRVDGLTLLVEPIRPPLDLLILGAGDDAQALAAMAAPLGWQVRVADKWPTLVTRERFEHAAQLTASPAEALLAAAGVYADTIAVLMTHSLADDATYLAGLCGVAHQVVMLGPRSRTKRIIATMAERGSLPPAGLMGGVQTPAGLDLGGDTPAEVAASIIAGIIAGQNHRTGGFLSASTGPIHAEHERIIVDE